MKEMQRTDAYTTNFTCYIRSILRLIVLNDLSCDVVTLIYRIKRRIRPTGTLLPTSIFSQPLLKKT